MKGSTLILSALLAVSAVGNSAQYYVSKNELQTQEKRKQDLEEKVSVLTHNTESEVRSAVGRFLDAFFTTGSPTRLSSVATDHARKSLQVPGQEEGKSSVSVKSKVTGSDVYFSKANDSSAHVLTKVKRQITVNGVPSENEILLDLQLVYDLKAKTWLINNMHMLSQYE